MSEKPVKKEKNMKISSLWLILCAAVILALGIWSGLIIRDNTQTPIATVAVAADYTGLEYFPGYGWGTGEDFAEWKDYIDDLKHYKANHSDAISPAETAWLELMNEDETDWLLIVDEFSDANENTLDTDPNGAYANRTVYDKLERIQNSVHDSRSLIYAGYAADAQAKANAQAKADATAATATKNAEAADAYKTMVKCQNDAIEAYPVMKAAYDADVIYLNVQKGEFAWTDAEYNTAVDNKRAYYNQMAITQSEKEAFNTKVAATPVVTDLNSRLTTFLDSLDD